MAFAARYTVLWTAKAESQLAETWAVAADRASVAAAANALDADLAVDPYGVGESREDGLWFDIRNHFHIPTHHHLLLEYPASGLKNRLL